MLDRTPSEQVETRGHEPATRRSAAHGRTERAFVGRDRELAILRTGLETLGRGHGASFLIAGEAGIGKTRLASQFSAELAVAGVTVAWGRCWEAGGAPSYWPWVEVIRQLVGVPESTLDLGSHGLFLAQLVPDLAESFGVADLDAPSRSDPESARFLMFDAVSTLLRRVATTKPLAIVIDDLHMADRASVLLLTFVARRSADIPLLLVGTFRDRGADVPSNLVEPLADLARHATRIELDGLTQRDITSLLEAESSTNTIALAARIHDATSGNAFFVDEVLRSIASEVPLDEGGGALDVRIPSGVRDAARQRLAHIGSTTVRILEVAAVVGREFDASVVGRAVNERVVDVLAALEHPVELGIIEGIAERPGRLQFRHALIRDALYDLLPTSRRVALHQQVGEAFEALADSVPDRYLGELAHHFLIAAAAGDGRFVTHTVRAAQRALARMAFEDAVALYERALDALAQTKPDRRLRCELLLGLAEAKEWANDVVGSRRCLEDAAEIARDLNSTNLFVRAALGVGAVAARKFMATSRYETAPLLVTEALRRIDADDSEAKALLLSRLALHNLTCGTRERAEPLSVEAIAIARRAGDSEALAEALIARHAVLFGPDAMEERAAIAEEVLAIGNSLLRRDLVMRGHALRFTVRFECCDVRGADDDLEQHRNLAEQLSDPFDRWANLVWHGARVLLDGRFDEAQDYANRAIQLVASVPGPHSIEVNGPAAFIGQTVLIQDTATRNLELELIPSSYDSRFPELSMWRMGALLGSVRAGDVQAVESQINLLATRGFEDFQRNGSWLSTMSILSEAIALVRDRERAALAYPMLLPYARLQGTTSLVASYGSVSRYLGLLATALEQWDDADRHFSDAAASNRAMGAQPLLGKTFLDHGRMLLGRRQLDARNRGLDLVRQARAIANHFDMPGLLRDCDALLTVAEQQAGDCAQVPPHSLERAGNVWIIHHAGKQTPVGSTKGMAYIAELLRYPNREILAIDLIRALSSEPSTAPPPPRSAASRGIIRKRRHFTEDVLDAKARRAYQRRLDSLENELSSAEASGDPERVLELRDEIEQLERELSRGIGLGGRVRQSSDVERARISVTRAIHLALGRIAETAPEAGATLAQCIRTGTWCSYVPDAEAEVAFAEALETV